MGYYSSFKFFVLEDDEEILFKKDFFEKCLKGMNLDKCCEEILYAMQTKTTFYEQHEYMKEFSRKIPEKVFVVYRYGKECEDIEKTYYKDGKMKIYKAEINFPKFSEKELK